MKVVFPGAFLDELKYTSLTGVKATLINMPIWEQAKPNNPPLGPDLLAARLREYGAEPTIIDLNIYRVRDEDAAKRGLELGRTLTFEEAGGLISRTLNKVGSQHVIGLSGLITTLKWQTEIARVIKAVDPDAMLVSGGGLATQFRTDLFGWIPELDAVAHSEGDDVILKIAHDAKTIRDHGFEEAHLTGRLSPFLQERTANDR